MAPKKVSFIILFLLLVLIIPINSVAADGETPYIFDTTIPVSAEIKADVNAWLAVSAPVPVSYWAITYVGAADESGNSFVSLVALDLDSPDDEWHIYDDEIVKWMGSVIVHADHSIDVHSDGGYSDSVSRASPIKRASALLDGGGGNVRFPWEGGASMMYGTRGIHAAGGGGSYAIGFSAVDFLGGDDLGSSVASNRIYAVAMGEVDYVCEDATTTLIRTENTETDDYYIYAHLLDNLSLIEGYTFYQGDYIGSVKYGSFDDDCGWAEQTPQHYHLHFGFKPAGGFFTMEGCTLSMSTEEWDCGGETISTGQFIMNGWGGAPTTGEDAGGYATQFNFWDLMLVGASSMWDKFVLQNMPEHTANTFLYALYNGVSVAVRIARVMVYGNINLGHLASVVFFGLSIKAIFAFAEFIVFLFKAWKSLIPVIGA
jgi:hypothetical protein